MIQFVPAAGPHLSPGHTLADRADKRVSPSNQGFEQASRPGTRDWRNGSHPRTREFGENGEPSRTWISLTMVASQSIRALIGIDGHRMGRAGARREAARSHRPTRRRNHETTIPDVPRGKNDLLPGDTESRRRERTLLECLASVGAAEARFSTRHPEDGGARWNDPESSLDDMAAAAALRRRGRAGHRRRFCGPPGTRRDVTRTGGHGHSIRQHRMDRLCG